MTKRTDKAVAGIIASSTAFARAVDELRSADIARGGDGLLRDCVASLAEDHQTVGLYTDWNDDSKTLCSSFELAAPITEAEFKSDYYTEILQVLEGGPPRHARGAAAQ